jgi:hypothetical protein
MVKLTCRKGLVLFPFMMDGLLTLCLSCWNFLSNKSSDWIPNSKPGSTSLPWSWSCSLWVPCDFHYPCFQRLSFCSFYWFDYDNIGFNPVVYQWLCRCSLTSFGCLKSWASTLLTYYFTRHSFERENQGIRPLGPLINTFPHTTYETMNTFDLRGSVRILS